MTWAWKPVGTETLFDSIRIGEVREVRIKRCLIECDANWNPQDATHRRIFEAIQYGEHHDLVLVLPDSRGQLTVSGEVIGVCSLPASDVVTLTFGVKGRIEMGDSLSSDDRERMKEITRGIGSHQQQVTASCPTV